MGQLGFCARIFRNVYTFLITCKIELRGRSNLPPDRRLGQRSPAVVCPPPVVARSVFARHSPAIRPCVHSLPLAVVWGRVPARYGASYSRCCSLADQISHPLGVLRITPRGRRSSRRRDAWSLAPLACFHVDAAVVSEGYPFLRQQCSLVGEVGCEPSRVVDDAVARVVAVAIRLAQHCPHQP